MGQVANFQSEVIVFPSSLSSSLFLALQSSADVHAGIAWASNSRSADSIEAVDVGNISYGHNMFKFINSIITMPTKHLKKSESQDRPKFKIPIYMIALNSASLRSFFLGV